MQSLWLPAIRAQSALSRKNSKQAIDQLQLTQPQLEFGEISFINQITCLYPTYIRGQAFLAAGQGKEAAAEFQKILDRSGMVWNYWTGALAKSASSARTLCRQRTQQVRRRTRSHARLGCIHELPRALERCRPRRPDLQRSQSRIREAAVA